MTPTPNEIQGRLNDFWQGIILEVLAGANAPLTNHDMARALQGGTTIGELTGGTPEAYCGAVLELCLERRIAVYHSTPGDETSTVLTDLWDRCTPDQQEDSIIDARALEAKMAEKGLSTRDTAAFRSDPEVLLAELRVLESMMRATMAASAPPEVH